LPTGTVCLGCLRSVEDDCCGEIVELEHRYIRRLRLDRSRSIATHTREQWEELLSSVGGVCPRCMQRRSVLCKDHIRPVYQGGSDGINNLQPLCTPCNQAKGPESIDWLFLRGLRP
jgi:5-methylcytosine-specific restriction endonuclease McrA